MWAVVGVFCEPTICATTGGTDSWSTKPSTTAHNKCGSLNVEMVVVWTVVDAFCGPTVCATTGGTDSCYTKTSTTAHENCGSLNVDMVVVWAVVDVFVGQLSVPPQVAQTVAPQRHQQRPTKTAAHSMLTW